MLMVMFCLAGCGEEPAAEDDGDDEGSSEGSGNNGGNGGNGGLGSLGDIFNLENDIAFGIEVKDTEALLALMGADAIDIDSLKLDLYAGKGGEKVVALAAKLFEENHDIKIFGGDNSVAISSTLLDKAYGVSDLSAFMSKLSSQLVPDGSVAGTVASINVEKLTKFAEKYYNFIINELKNNAGLTVRDEGSVTVISGKLTTDAIATVVTNTLYELKDDSDFYSLFGISKEDFTSGMPSKADMLAQLKSILSEMPISITINSLKVDSKNTLKAFDIKVENSEAMMGIPAMNASVSYDVDAKTGKLELTWGEEYIKASIAPQKINVDADFTIIDENYYGTSTTAVKIKLNGNADGVTLDASVTQKGEYPSWDEVENSQMTCRAELDKSHLKFAFETKEEHTYDGETVKSSDKVDINATFSESGADASIKYTTAYSDTEYNDSYSETVEITAKLTITDNSIKLELSGEGESIVAEIKDSGSEIVGSVSMNGTEMGNIKLGKKVEGTKTTYTLKSFTANGVTTDFSDIGISVYFDTNATLPTLSGYTVIDDMTTDELQAIVNGIITRNETLFEKLEDALESSYREETTARPELRPIVPGYDSVMPDYSENVDGYYTDDGNMGNMPGFSVDVSVSESAVEQENNGNYLIAE